MKIVVKLAACAAALIAAATGARAESNEQRISKGFGIHYLPLYIMEKQKLVEKHAADWKELFLPPAHGLPGS